MAAGLAAALASTGPAAAQQISEGYQFLKALRAGDAEKALTIMNKPGSTILTSKDYNTGDTGLHIVTARRDLVWMKFLIDRGANINATNGSGETALMTAVQLRFADGVDVLIRLGALVDKADGRGETPLIRAVHLKSADIVRRLVAAGANADKRDLTGMSAREYAQRDARGSGIVELLGQPKAPGAAKSGPVQGPRL